MFLPENLGRRVTKHARSTISSDPAHYTEVLAILPMVLLLAGLLIAVGIDPYIQKRQKRIMLIICALVFSLIAQNELDHLLTIGRPMVMLRRVVDIYGYSIRPVILLLFLYIVSHRKNHVRYGRRQFPGQHPQQRRGGLRREDHAHLSQGGLRFQFA